MKSHSEDEVSILAKSPFGTIQRCRSGGYHVSVQQVTLHLSTEGFGCLVDLVRQAQAFDGHPIRSNQEGVLLDFFNRQRL